ncbi:fibronectin type III domain-containing protein [Bifidobacterium catenulatum]|uniref:fibronectin type III domain-containing protein n=2 Tax=Bifidobacterium catenulatum TaxID=1686 RepID=UPI00232F3E04|nr:fibronectin type III domain-containing protein [Bifidobacterium catenulatum]MDB6910557.1 fibronectin type III domain-containing protein [Bifidobacterium catenulatum]
MSKSLHARLVAYRPFGARIGVLAEPVSFSASMLHNDDGAISIEYSMLSGDAQAFDRELADGLEVAVEVSDGTGYREPDNARYVITGRSGKTDDRTRTVTYSGQSISWLLSKAENNDSSHLLADGDNKGKRPFYSANPGTILKTLLDENRQRGGVATGLSLGFDTAKDSNGDAWNKKYTLYYSLGADLQTILSSLVNGGGCDWRTTGRTLKMWNADSAALSRDLSKSVILQLARDIGEAPFEESIADLASTILVEGDNNLLFRMDNPAAPTPWGKWESYSSQGGVSDKDTAQAFMQSTLDDAARVRGQYTRDLVISEVDALPLVDYHAGDWITAPTVSHGEKVRVQEIDLSMRQGEGLSASIALNDIKYDASVRQAKKIKGITGGAALAGSEGGTTASSNRDHRVPKAPLGLIVQTDAYIGSDGYAHGLATASWSAVTQATNDTSIEISTYTVEWKLHKDGATWHSAGTTDKTQLGFGGLDCGTQIEVRVRAVPTYSDKIGEWSEVSVVTVESDTTPCSVPSKPVLSSELGVVTVHWDGRTAAGTSMESDFDHIEVGEGATASSMKVVSATQAGQGDYIVTGLSISSQHSYALRSVDHAGNKSGWSSIASVTVASAVPQETLDSINQGIAKAEAEAKAAKTTADGKNKVFTQATEPAHAGLTNGDLWQKLDSSGHISSVNVWNGTKFTAYSLVADSLLVPGSVNGSVLIKDGTVEAKNIKIGNGEILTELLKARKIVTDDVEAGQFKGYVFTGAIFQSSEAENTGMKLNSRSLRMWDSAHNQTVYLDGEGKSNLLTGTFQTRTSGHRVRISPDYQSYAIGGSETFTGDGLEFPAYKGNSAYYSFPAIASVIQSNQVGAMGELDLWSGHIAKNDPAAFMRLVSKPRERGGTGAQGIKSEVFATANTDYDEPDESKKSSASLTLSGDSQNGSNVWLEAVDGGGSVGIGANIHTGYVYLGGYLGGITNRHTFQSTNWRIYQNATLAADFTVPQTTWSWTPTKYGRYYGVCNSDLNWGSIFMHVCNTGGAGSLQVMGYNAGNGAFHGDMYVNAIAWLTK